MISVVVIRRLYTAWENPRHIRWEKLFPFNLGKKIKRKQKVELGCGVVGKNLTEIVWGLLAKKKVDSKEARVCPFHTE